jgi:flavin reductase (DIM6/NTAB) family NADH-FMN oxidoreductase RutF
MEPSILYFGTSVVLLSTLNEDGTANLAPISSAWWLGWNCMLGLGAKGQTAQNLLREKECVLNLLRISKAIAFPVFVRAVAEGARHGGGVSCAA